MPEIEIHTLGWKGSSAIKEEEEPDVTILCRVFIEGVEVPGVMNARPVWRNGEFSFVTIRSMAAVKTVTHTQETWDALPKPV